MVRRRRTVALVVLKEVRLATEGGVLHGLLSMHYRQTQTIVTLLVALAILHLRTAHSIYYAMGATSSAVFG